MIMYDHNEQWYVSKYAFKGYQHTHTQNHTNSGNDPNNLIRSTTHNTLKRKESGFWNGLVKAHVWNDSNAVVGP